MCALLFRTFTEKSNYFYHWKYVFNIKYIQAFTWKHYHCLYVLKRQRISGEFITSDEVHAKSSKINSHRFEIRSVSCNKFIQYFSNDLQIAINSRVVEFWRKWFGNISISNIPIIDILCSANDSIHICRSLSAKFHIQNIFELFHLYKASKQHVIYYKIYSL